MKTFILISVFIISIFTNKIYPQNWATVGGNNQRNGLSKIVGPDSIVSPAWSITSTISLWGNSVYTYGDKFVTSRVVFTPSYTAKIECRSVTDGSLLWDKQVSSSSIMYAVGFSEFAVYVHDYSNDSLYALSPSDGSVMWAVYEDMFGANSGVLYNCGGDPVVRGKRIDKYTGETVWHYDYIIPVAPNAGYAAYGNTYYHYKGAINTAKTVFALDMETGDFKYESVPLDGDGDQEMPLTIGNDGTIYICRDGGNLYALEDTGNELSIKWQYDPVGSNLTGTFGSDSAGNIYIIDYDAVKLLSKDNGRVLDSSNISIPVGFNPAISVDGEGKVYICNSLDNGGKYYCFSRDLHTLIWEMPVPYNYYCGPALAKDGTLIIIGSGTEIKAFRPNRNLKPVADFTTDSVLIYAGTGLNFYDQSSFHPIAWQWNFPGGAPSVSSEQNPSDIIYSVPGDYEVSLAVSNSLGTDTLFKSCYIKVLPSVSVVDEKQESYFYLSQNYPNPFNPATTIHYQLRNNSFVTLKIYDMLGNETSTLVNEEKPAGSYEVRFDASSGTHPIASGVYFYVLRAGGFVQVRKMVLLR
jgi:PKD repeat protein